MAITFDPVKRAAALQDRKLDFADAAKVFDGNVVTMTDDRFAYGETRLITAGYLVGRMVVIVWTPRSTDRHVISMRYCHAKEEKRWRREIERQIPSDIRKNAD